MKKILFIVLLISNIQFMFAQVQTQVKGKVIDSVTKKPVPYAGVGFYHTTVGTITDDKGEFFINYIRPETDTIVVQCLGYEPDTFRVEAGKFNEVEFNISQKSYGIDEVVVTPGENPAHILLRKVIKSKKRNNPYKLDGFSYEGYTKIQLDINNFDPNLAKKKYMKKLSIVFDGMDTAQNGKVYMPLLISENISDFYYQRRPKRKREIIKAVKVSGIENESLSRYTGEMYTKINFYENYMSLFQKQFVSPLAFNGLMVYKYYLTDSTYIDGVWCRKIRFRPRRKHEYTFEGNFWIEDKTNALKQIYARISRTANVDFVHELIVKQSFEQVNDSVFFLQHEDFFADVNLTEQTTGFFGRKVTNRKNIKVNPKYPDNFFSSGYAHDISPEEEARNKSKTFWDSARHVPLEEKEKQVYIMTDSVKNLRIYKNIERFTKGFITGYVPLEKIEIGSIYEIYTHNQTEGSRIQAGMRTSKKFSEKIRLKAHVAFGFKDQRIKYGGLVKYKIRKRPWTMAQIGYNHDMIPLGMSFMNYSENVFSSVLARTPNDNLLMQNNLTANIERDLFRGISVTLFADYKEIFPSASVPFITENNTTVNSLYALETGLTLHFGFNEEYVEGIFSRMSLNSLYPITEITYTTGLRTFDNSYQYHKFNFFLSHRFYLGPFGKFKYDIEAGKIFGKVPFPLLKLFNGNESYMLRRQAFNLMNIYEFAADQYVSLFVVHHFQGLFLNRIPLMRRLKWREVAFVRAALGTLKNENRTEYQFPGYLNDVTKPYIEGGVGVENIFNFFRVDAVWRFSHLHNENAPRFGIRLGFYVGF